MMLACMCGGSDNQVYDTEENDSKQKYGKPRQHDENFKGPVKNRSCTDIICCLLFLVCIAGMVTVSAVGFARGNPMTLIYPTNSDGEICGVGSQSGKPNLVYFDILKCTSVGIAAIVTGCPTPSVCQTSCPTDYYVYLETAALKAAGTATTDDYNKMICKSSIDAETLVTAGTKSVQNLVDEDSCAAYYVPSTALVQRCIPSIFKTITDKVTQLAYTSSSNSQTYGLENSDSSGSTSVTGQTLDDASYYLAKFYELKGYGELVFKDFLNSWWIILACLGGAAVVCFIWIILLRWLAGIMVWATFIAALACMSYATYYSYDRYYDLKYHGSPSEEYGISKAFEGNFSYYLGLKKTWLAFGCTFATLLTLFLLIFLFIVKRICIAIELIKEASRAIGHMIFTLFWPILPFFMELAVIAYYVASAVYVGSMGSAEFYNSGTNTTDDGGVTYYLKRAPCSTGTTVAGQACEFVKYGGDEYTIPLEIFLLFMFFWLMNFIVALGQMTLAGAFGSYYFAFEKPKDMPAFPLTGALYRSIRYHFGSLAFGSLLIAIVQMVRVFLEYIDHKVKGSENPVAKIHIKCLNCCMWCLEKFLRFLNKNAYILIAVRGKNFCLSAKDAFFLIMRNLVRIIVLDKVTDFVLFISKIVVVSAVTIGAFYGFQGKIPYFSDYVPTLNFYLTPVIFVAIGTFLIASCFFSVYSMAVDTLFLCFLEDLEMNDGSSEKPYYMSKDMMKVLGKKNRVEPQEKKDKTYTKDKKKKKRMDSNMHSSRYESWLFHCQEMDVLQKRQNIGQTGKILIRWFLQ